MADDTPPGRDEREVVDNKDVRDLSEDEVNSEIDKMLQGEQPDASADDLTDMDESDGNTEENPRRMVDADEHAESSAPSPVAGTQAAAHAESQSDDNRRSEQSGSIVDEVDDVSELDPAQVDPADLEAQEWTLGQDTGDELIDVSGTAFLLSEPKDDAVLDIVGDDPNSGRRPAERMRDLCQEAVSAPQLTSQRWDGMKMAEKFRLMLEVTDFLGLRDMMDFQDVGAGALQE